MSDIPATPEQITTGWVNDVVFAGAGPLVRRLDTAVIGAGRGLLSQTMRVTLDFETPGHDAPRSIIVKILPKDGSFRALGTQMRAFEREINFYSRIAPTVGLRLPRIYLSELRPEASVLVMEDLGHLSCGDQVRGIPHRHTLAAAREIAKVHAIYWNNEPLRGIDWAPEHDRFDKRGFVEHWPKFADAFGLRIGKTGIALGDRVAANIDQLEKEILARPTALIHGDLRGDNLLFGAPGAKDEVLIIDWQLVSKGLATFDIARLLGGSQPVAERGGRQGDIIRMWYRSLTNAGVSGYSFDEACDDFCLSALQCLMIPVRVLQLAGDDPEEGRVGRLLDAMADRFFASAIEIGADEMLPD